VVMDKLVLQLQPHVPICFLQQQQCVLWVRDPRPIPLQWALEQACTMFVCCVLVCVCGCCTTPVYWICCVVGPAGGWLLCGVPFGLAHAAARAEDVLQGQQHVVWVHDQASLLLQWALMLFCCCELAGAC
jgi:hypothetical protein